MHAFNKHDESSVLICIGCSSDGDDCNCDETTDGGNDDAVV